MENLSEKIRTLFVQNETTLSVAESITGGALAHQLTLVPGASIYFLGGVVAYSNTSKEHLLHVKPETLKAYGAVSEQVAKEMAEGALKAFNSDYALSITGVAGPSGGSQAKPIGFAWCALASKQETIAWTFQSQSGKRKEIIHDATHALLQKLIQEISV